MYSYLKSFVGVEHVVESIHCQISVCQFLLSLRVAVSQVDIDHRFNLCRSGLYGSPSGIDVHDHESVEGDLFTLEVPFL